MEPFKINTFLTSDLILRITHSQIENCIRSGLIPVSFHMNFYFFIWAMKQESGFIPPRRIFLCPRCAIGTKEYLYNDGIPVFHMWNDGIALKYSKPQSVTLDDIINITKQ